MILPDAAVGDDDGDESDGCHFSGDNTSVSVSMQLRDWCTEYVHRLSMSESKQKNFIVNILTFITCFVGGVAQWLGCRSVAGGLSPIYARSMVDV